MFKKIMREIALFLGYTGLIIYVLVYCLLGFLINLLKGTKIAKLISLVQKGLEKCTEIIVMGIIEQLKEWKMWY